MTSQAPKRIHPEPIDREERHIQAFANLFGEIRTMDLEPDTVRALLDATPFEEDPTGEPSAVARPD